MRGRRAEALGYVCAVPTGLCRRVPQRSLPGRAWDAGRVGGWAARCTGGPPLESTRVGRLLIASCGSCWHDARYMMGIVGVSDTREDGTGGGGADASYSMWLVRFGHVAER